MINVDEAADFHSALRLFAIKALVSGCNVDRLAQWASKHFGMEGGVEAAVARIHATDSGRTTGRDEDLPPKQLFVRVGARVMLRRNMCVSLGLVNGALGTVVDIVYDRGQTPPGPPFCILVQFGAILYGDCGA